MVSSKPVMEMPPVPWRYERSTVWANDVHVFDAEGEWVLTITQQKNAPLIAEGIVSALNREKKGRKKT